MLSRRRLLAAAVFSALARFLPMQVELEAPIDYEAEWVESLSGWLAERMDSAFMEQLTREPCPAWVKEMMADCCPHLDTPDQSGT